MAAPSFTSTAPGLRLAALADIPALERLIAASARGLQLGDYSARQIEGALGSVFGVDRRLIEDGCYYVLDAAGQLAACGGWSFRRTLFGADAVAGRDDAELIPGVDAARIRAFFVHPDWARRGLADRLLAECEAAARARGFDRLELGATLTGEPMYARRGFVAAGRVESPLPGGGTLPVVRMTKVLIPPPADPAPAGAAP